MSQLFGSGFWFFLFCFILDETVLLVFSIFFWLSARPISASCGARLPSWRFLNGLEALPLSQGLAGQFGHTRMEFGISRWLGSIWVE
jgi:hypothetical protein